MQEEDKNLQKILANASNESVFKIFFAKIKNTSCFF